jgi:hypothetical protein
MNRLTCILLSICILLSPTLVRACQTCYGKKLTEERAQREQQLKVLEMRKKILNSMKQEAEVITQDYDQDIKGYYVPSSKPSSGHHRHKIGSSQRDIEMRNKQSGKPSSRGNR